MTALKIRYLLWTLFIVVTAVVLGTALWTRMGPWPKTGGWQAKPLEGLSRYGEVPEFSLIERSGEPAGLDDLRGKIWVADFIYTSCTDTCPLESAAMAKLQDEFDGRTDLRLVSFSVDPERDSPEVLSRYAARYKAGPDRWLFLTGDKRRIARLVQGGFHLSAVAATDGSDAFLHSSRFVLVDRAAQIRGYYDSRDPEALRRLKKDLNSLLRSSKVSSHQAADG